MPMNTESELLVRRHFLRDCGVGLGKIALGSLLVAKPQVAGAANPFAPKKPHFPAKAKAVIHLFMAGAPSQLDLFDHKPELAKFEGKPIPPRDHRRSALRLHPPRCRARSGRGSSSRSTASAGAELAEVLPHLAKSSTTSA